MQLQPHLILRILKYQSTSPTHLPPSLYAKEQEISVVKLRQILTQIILMLGTEVAYFYKP